MNGSLIHHLSARSRVGFSILELTIVLAIIAIIAGAGMSMATNSIKIADRIGTQEKLNTIKLALDSFAKTYGYLPCPFDRSLVPSGAAFGVENRSGASCGVLISSNVAIGGVPVRTLGLPDSYASDAWGNKLTYGVSVGLVGDPARYPANGGAGAAIALRYGTLSSYYTMPMTRNSATYTSAASSGGLVNLAFGSAHGISSTAFIIHVAGSVYKGSYTISSIPDTTHLVLANSTYTTTDTGSITWQDVGTAATYVVVSHGPDGRGAYPTNSAGVPANKLCVGVAAGTSPPPCTSSATTTCIDIENCNNDHVFQDAAYSDSLTVAAQYFDDFVVWGSNASVRTAVSPALYATCPSGICEAWCAPCTINYPGAGATVPPATATGAVTNPILCKKVVTAKASTCSATCFWSGTNLDGKGAATSGYQKCP